MSQFDFPRINFHGHAFVDPGTANNNYYLPLAIYDPINGKAFLPPRIFLNKKYLRKDISKEEFIKLIPLNHKILKDDNGNEYLEINSILSKEQFVGWAKVPLGKHDYDKDFHRLYDVLVSPKSKKVLTGIVPAYWNYYGKMTFGFMDVKISSIETFDLENRNAVLYNSRGDELFSDIVGAELSFNDRFGTKTGVMIDVCPTLSVYSQTFLMKWNSRRERNSCLKANLAKGHYV